MARHIVADAAAAAADSYLPSTSLLYDCHRSFEQSNPYFERSVLCPSVDAIVRPQHWRPTADYNFHTHNWLPLILQTVAVKMCAIKSRIIKNAYKNRQDYDIVDTENQWIVAGNKSYYRPYLGKHNYRRPSHKRDRTVRKRKPPVDVLYIQLFVLRVPDFAEVEHNVSLPYCPDRL